MTINLEKLQREMPDPEAQRLLGQLVDCGKRYRHWVKGHTVTMRTAFSPVEKTEVEYYDRSRRQSHEALIDSYRILNRYVFRQTGKPCSLTQQVPIDAPRADIGDLGIALANASLDIIEPELVHALSAHHEEKPRIQDVRPWR